MCSDTRPPEEKNETNGSKRAEEDFNHARGTGKAYQRCVEPESERQMETVSVRHTQTLPPLDGSIYPQISDGKFGSLY